MEVRPAVVPEPETEPALRLDEVVRCRRCHSEVTHRRDAIAVDGAHQHSFRNPAGWSYQVACFASAPGASGEGEVITAYTWFAGYAWRVALCRRCGTHLGWWYAGPTTFAGLIVTRVG